MLKGLALTPPVIGRISIGKVVEKNGKRLPEKDDEFTLTSQVQGRDGWINHPLDELLRKDKSTKLRSIPVRLLFDDPDLSLRAYYTVFDRDTGRPLCVGDGETCKRSTISGMQSYPCPAPPSCPLAEGGRCKPYGRLHVRIEVDEEGSDELGSFVLRTTGFNSIRTHVETEMAQIGCRLKVALEIDGVSAILDLVADGAGAALLSRNAVTSCVRPSAYQVRDVPPAARQPDWCRHHLPGQRQPTPGRPGLRKPKAVSSTTGSSDAAFAGVVGLAGCTRNVCHNRSFSLEVDHGQSGSQGNSIAGCSATQRS